MSTDVEVTKRLQAPVRVMWVLFFSFVIYLVLTLFLAFSHVSGVRPTLLFEDNVGNLFGIAMVAFYLALGLPVTHYFYKHTLRTPPHHAYTYALAAIIVGVAAPYIYALLVSFMGIMRGILPLGFVGFFYISGIIIGLRILSRLTAYLRSQ
jgi:hypothetical protein